MVSDTRTTLLTYRSSSTNAEQTLISHAVFTLTKPKRQHITEPLPKRTTDKPDEDLDFSEAAMEEEYGG